MTQPKYTKDNRIRRGLEIVLLLAGLAGVSAWLASSALPVLWQDWENWAFDRELLGAPATVTGYLDARQQQIVRDVSLWLGLAPRQAPASPAHAATGSPRRSAAGIQNNVLVGRLAIPRLRLSAVVREGIGPGTLGLAVGHVPGTALPGQNGNVGVAGHRDTLFRGLGEIRNNDLIQFETLHGSYVYEVASTEIVKPRDVGVLQAGEYPELTLVTCYPFNFIGSAPDRFIVKARQISSMVRPVTTGTNYQGSRSDDKPVVPGRVNFNLSTGHSRTLAPGISIGVDSTNVADQRMNGWMWILQDRRTIWLRNQGTQAPLVFDGFFDGKKRELWITEVKPGSVSGYLVLPRE